MSTSSTHGVTRADRRLSVAPMLDCTDRFCRYMLRLISKNTLLYTEMINSGTIVHGDADHHLKTDPIEHPLALQLGGSNPSELAYAARQAAPYGYGEINLNCGCPSDRVQSGMFGACLMKDPPRVAECIAALRESVNVPVTVKHRIGVDDFDSYEFMRDFVATVADAGCNVFIVHARKAWLKGLSPKQNREIPPLHYESVYRLKQELPQLSITINGGITSLEQTLQHLQHVDGVMIGREIYNNPYLLAQADQLIYGSSEGVKTRRQICAGMFDYIDNELAAGSKLHYMTRHMLGLFHQVPGARRFRRHISENIHKPGAGPEVLHRALEYIEEQD